MSYIVIKTINGRQYRYRQRSYRVGKKVKTESVYLGLVSGGLINRVLDFIEAQRLSPEDRALAVVEKGATRVEQYQREVFGETATERGQREQREHLDRLHDLYGLKLGATHPTPVEKSVPNAPAADSSSASGIAEQSVTASTESAPTEGNVSADAAGQDANANSL